MHRIDLSMERREPRGALAATVEVGGTLVHVLAAHLGLRIHERRFQVRQILEYLDSVRNTLFVVLGDFNDWLPGGSVVHVLDRRLGRPPRPASFPVFLADRAAGSHLGSSDAGVAADLHAHDSDGQTGVGSFSRGGRHRRRLIAGDESARRANRISLSLYAALRLPLSLTCRCFSTIQHGNFVRGAALTCALLCTRLITLAIDPST